MDTKNYIRLKIVDQRNSHLLTLQFIAAAFGIFALIPNIYAEAWMRSGLLSIGILSILASILVSKLWHIAKTAQILAALGTILIMFTPLLFNGGLVDPRSALSIPLLGIWNLTFFGAQHLKKIISLLLVLIVAVLIFQYFGLLEFIRQDNNGNDPALKLVTVLMITAMLVGIYLFTKDIKLLLSLLESETSRALDALQAESRFLSNMSHEIRNPLNAIKGLIDQAVTEHDRDLRSFTLHLANDACLQLGEIVDEILDFKKIQEGEIKILSKSFDFHALQSTIEANFRSQLKRGQLDFISELDHLKVPRYLKGDPIKITQVLSNIISNAIKFTPSGGCIMTKATYDHKEGILNYVIRDTGIGISPDFIPDLFKRFKQSDNTLSKQHQGTGLGLAICRELIEMMHGTITAESAKGEGSTFIISLPLLVDHETENAFREDRMAEILNTDPQKVELTGIRVLCVDDSDMNLRVISRPLTASGAEVAGACSAKEALEIMKSANFDVILTDISMPEMDGEQLRRAIHETSPELPVVAVTGNVLDDDIRRYLQDGFSETIGKPIDKHILIKTVARLASAWAKPETASIHLHLYE